jgi:hypothetical protein
MRSEPDRHVKEAIKESAFNGTHFRSTGYTTTSVFQVFIDNDDVNPAYDRKEKAYINDPDKYDGN